jgi:hypothetical protein
VPSGGIPARASIFSGNASRTVAAVLRAHSKRATSADRANPYTAQSRRGNRQSRRRIRVLEDTFPVVCRLVDKRFFAYAAHEYLREHPPHSRCLVGAERRKCVIAIDSQSRRRVEAVAADGASEPGRLAAKHRSAELQLRSALLAGQDGCGRVPRRSPTRAQPRGRSPGNRGVIREGGPAPPFPPCNFRRAPR